MSKYLNRKTVVDGITFASAKEARRYGELKLLERAGKIRNLEVQPRYPLVVSDVKVCTYIADFAYRDVSSVVAKLVVEDVKSAATRTLPVYRLKAKLFAALKGFPVTEV